jgi:hypothetical protein
MYIRIYIYFFPHEYLVYERKDKDDISIRKRNKKQVVESTIVLFISIRVVRRYINNYPLWLIKLFILKNYSSDEWYFSCVR